MLSDSRLDGLLKWLPHRGTAVTSVALSLQPGQITHKMQLPPGVCSLQLQLQGWNSTAPRLSGAAAANLTSLIVQTVSSHVEVPSGSVAPAEQLLLQQIPGLTQLRHLSLIFEFNNPLMEYEHVLEAVSGLKHLTFLEQGEKMHYGGLGHQQQQCLAQLTKLQQLRLNTRRLVGFEHLQALTGLSLAPGHSWDTIYGDSSSIGALTSLRSLELEKCSLTGSFSAVSQLTGLTVLHLEAVTFTEALHVAFLPWLAGLPLSGILLGMLYYPLAGGAVQQQQQRGQPSLPALRCSSLV